MDAFRRRRNNVTGVAANRSSSDLLASTVPASLRGKKERNFANFASDSSSSSSFITEEYLLTVDLIGGSSRKSVGMPMKKLLAEGMSKENGSRRRSPSVIARLMGLDGLPPQQPSQQQEKKSTEHGQEKAQKSCTFYGRPSLRKNSKDEQEFKDVFEVFDSEKVESASYSSQGTGNLKRTEAEMAFIWQKFMDVKRLSTDEKLQDSKELDDALEVLDSNKDLLLKFLQKPDSLFTKHLHDLQNGPPESHCGHMSAIKSSQTLLCENGSLRQRTDRESRWKNHSKSPQNHQADILSNSYAVKNYPKSSKVRVEEQNELVSLPTRIVVLKPNLEKSHNAARTSSSPSSSHHLPSDCEKHTEIMGIKNREVEVWGKKRVYGDLGILRPNSKESREIAKEITMKMRSISSSSSLKFSTSKFKGYAGDESSCDISGSESANDSDVTTLTSRGNFGRNNRYRSSSSRSSESSVSREAKKRLSERWKMTHGSQEVCLVSRGSTLGEMLAIPDSEVRPTNLTSVIEAECSHILGSDDGTSLWVEPLGISSKDGWKDGCLSNLSRSRSLPASADFGNPRTSLRREVLFSDKYVMPKDSRKRDRNKAVKGKFSQREGSLSRNSRVSIKKSQLLITNNNKGKDDTPSQVGLPEFLEKSNLDGCGQSLENPVVSEASASTVTATSVLHEEEEDVNNRNMAVCSGPSHLELSASVNGDFSAADPDTLASQEKIDGPHEGVPSHHPGPQLESYRSTKEADHPSPVSVLEAPFADDFSSGSECFESLSADIHGLRMQLQLLKLESMAYAEGSMLLSSDDEADEVSTGIVAGTGILRAEENLESSYISDVLIDSGISGTDPDTFMATWYSPDCPINPFVFEELEKKYCNLTSWSRDERKLIFDCINSKLLEIYQQSTNQYPWVKPARRIHSKWNKQGLEDSLHSLLAVRGKKAKKDAIGKVLGREIQWLDTGDEIGVIGREIEQLLVDELVAEVAAL